VCFKVGFLVGAPLKLGQPRLGASNEALLRHNRRSQPQLVQVSWFPNPVTEDHPKSIRQQTFSDYVYSICIIQNTYIYIYTYVQNKNILYHAQNLLQGPDHKHFLEDLKVFYCTYPRGAVAQDMYHYGFHHGCLGVQVRELKSWKQGGTKVI
jgi:hypothetical protein